MNRKPKAAFRVLSIPGPPHVCGAFPPESQYPAGTEIVCNGCGLIYRLGMDRGAASWVRTLRVIWDAP